MTSAFAIDALGARTVVNDSAMRLRPRRNCGRGSRWMWGCSDK